MADHDLEEIKKRADEAKHRMEFVVASVQRLIDERDDKKPEEVIYPSAEMIDAEVNR